MKFSRPVQTLLAGAILVGVVACGDEDRVADTANSEEGLPQLTETPARDAGIPGAQDRVETVDDVANRAGDVRDPNTPLNTTLADSATRQADLSAAAIDSGVIPDELLEDDSRLNRLAIARLEPTSGNQASGLVSFIETEGEAGIRIMARITGLPDGEHGIHIHEYGDCSGAAASAAGEHLNPANQPHAARDDDTRHAGDLGNVTAMNQMATLDITDEQLNFEGVNSVVARAVIVHANADDLTTQPSGNSGDPVACGVVQLQDTSALSFNN